MQSEVEPFRHDLLDNAKCTGKTWLLTRVIGYTENSSLFAQFRRGKMTYQFRFCLTIFFFIWPRQLFSINSCCVASVIYFMNNNRSNIIILWVCVWPVFGIAIIPDKYIQHENVNATKLFKLQLIICLLCTNCNIYICAIQWNTSLRTIHTNKLNEFSWQKQTHNSYIW